MPKPAKLSFNWELFKVPKDRKWWLETVVIPLVVAGVGVAATVLTVIATLYARSVDTRLTRIDQGLEQANLELQRTSLDRSIIETFYQDLFSADTARQRFAIDIMGLITDPELYERVLEVVAETNAVRDEVRQAAATELEERRATAYALATRFPQAVQPEETVRLLLLTAVCAVVHVEAIPQAGDFSVPLFLYDQQGLQKEQVTIANNTGGVPTSYDFSIRAAPDQLTGLFLTAPQTTTSSREPVGIGGSFGFRKDGSSVLRGVVRSADCE